MLELRKRSLTFSFTIILVLSALAFNVSTVKAEPKYYVSVTVDGDYKLRGETLTVTTLTNSTSFLQQIYNPQGKLIYNKTRTTNLTFTIPSSAEYGTYTIKSLVGSAEATTWVTVLDISDWKPTVFPYTVKHKGVSYTFYSNGTFRAEGSNGNLTLNFNSLVKLAKTHDLKVSATYNDMNFRVRFYNTGTDIDINMVFSFIWKGCKFIIHGTIDKERQFTFNLSRHGGFLKRFVDGVRSGNLVFDWSDLRRAKHRFEYDKETKVLTVDVPKSFNLDPYIFEDGFESGDFSAWDGTEATGTLEITSSPVYQGSYACKATITDYEYATPYKNFASPPSTIYARFYVYLDTYSVSSGGYVDLMSWRDVSAGSTFCSLRVYDTSRQLRLVYDGNTDTSSTTLDLDTWYCVEVKYVKSSGSGEYRVYLDGSEVTDLTHTGLTTTRNAERLRLNRGSSGVTSAVVIHDCVVVDDSYIGPLTSNNPPVIGEFQAPSTVYANQWFYLNASVNDADGISEIVNATIELSNNVILKWDNATATFSEQFDTNNYCTLNATACIETEKNSTAFKLSWRLKLNNYPSGSVNILSSNTKVWDSTESGNNSETGLFTFSYITLNLQARDSSGTNLPRSVTFSGTLGNGTTFTKTSNTNGLATLTTCYGTHTVQVKWGTHLVKSSTSFSVTSNKTQNFDTTIARLNSGSYYVLISINQTTPVTPEINGLPNWKMYGISGSGQKDLKVDVANWVDTSQPSIIKVMGNPYETGWNWDGTNKILSGFTLDFDANPSLNLEMEWGTSSGGPGGSSGGSDTVPVTPEEEPEKPQDTIDTPVYIIPEYQQPVIPTDTVTTIIVGSCIVVCIGLVINWLFEQNSTSKLWNRKSKKPKWKK